MVKVGSSSVRLSHSVESLQLLELPPSPQTPPPQFTIQQQRSRGSCSIQSWLHQEPWSCRFHCAVSCIKNLSFYLAPASQPGYSRWIYRCAKTLISPRPSRHPGEFSSSRKHPLPVLPLWNDNKLLFLYASWLDKLGSIDHIYQKVI